MENEIAIKQEMGVEGYYNMVVRDAKTLEVKRETGWFKNIITNIGLDRMSGNDGTSSFVNGFMSGGIAVGTGTNEPLPTDTTLQARKATTASILSTSYPYSGVVPYWSGIRRTWRFAQGVAAGNLTEVGLWLDNASPWRLGSRSLIKDASGNPTTLTVLSNEVLDVMYECRVYAQVGDVVSGPISILYTNYTFTMRACNCAGGYYYNLIRELAGGATYGYSQSYRVRTWTGPIGVVTGQPSGVAIDTGVVTTIANYSMGSYKRVHTFTLSTAQGNHTIRSIQFLEPNTPVAQWQFELDPPFVKDSTKTLTISVEFSWARRP